MVIVAPAIDWWMAFNPETCAMHKVWQGKMDFRGKVWDFSQDNSRAEGRILFASPSEIWRLADDGRVPDGWKSDGLVPEKGGWTFPTSGAKLTSPPFDASGWRRVFLAFDETGRKGRVHVELADQAGRAAPQWFESATSVDSDTNWQWNFKRVERPTSSLRVTLSSTVPGKRVRNLRMYGDRPSWAGADGRPLSVVWGGYGLTDKTKAVDIDYTLRLPSGKSVSVRHRPESTQDGWTETLTVKGLPRGGSIALRREGLSGGVDVGGQVPFKNGKWTFARDGAYRLTFSLRRGSR